jgi:predicted house-cleaning noncanonical NTP pyrophosphatase (MazG superfamily)
LGRADIADFKTMFAVDTDYLNELATKMQEEAGEKLKKSNAPLASGSG